MALALLNLFFPPFLSLLILKLSVSLSLHEPRHSLLSPSLFFFLSLLTFEDQRDLISFFSATLTFFPFIVVLGLVTNTFAFASLA